MGKLTMEWSYKDKNGEAFGTVRRFDEIKDNKPHKQTIPYFNPNGQVGIPDNFPTSKRLYGLDTVKDNSKLVFIVEGEKCAFALHGLGCRAVTSLGGCKSANKADWSLFSGVENVVLLPDNDPNGNDYMQDIYKILQKLNSPPQIQVCVLPDLPEKGDVCDWLKSQKSLCDWNEFDALGAVTDVNVISEIKNTFNSIIKEQKGYIPPEWRIKEGFNGLRCISMGDMLRLNIPKRKALLSPWLTEQSLSMVFADRGVGKTYFALNCAYALATASSFLKYESPEKTSVLYIDGEMQMPLMIERFRQIAGDNIKNIPISIITPDLQGDKGIPDLSGAAGQKEINEIIDYYDSKVIFVDNISTLCRSGRENEGESWLSIQTWAIKQRSKGRSIVFVHHANKGGEQRGSSRKEDVLDNVIRLQRPDDYDSGSDGAKFEIEFTKARSLFGEDIKPLIVEFVSNDSGGIWKWNSLQSPQEQCIEMLKDGCTQREIAEILGVNKSTISRWKTVAEGTTK